jgi:hypothetical protein
MVTFNVSALAVLHAAGLVGMGDEKVGRKNREEVGGEGGIGREMEGDTRMLSPTPLARGQSLRG